MARQIERHWSFRGPADEAQVAAWMGELAIPRPAAELLLRRGHSSLPDVDALLGGSAESEHDPSLLAGVEAAAARLWRAIDDGERIVVHGDYDADGISGTALLCGALRRAGASCEPFVPDRQRDGYGVADRLIEHAGARDVRVLVTVDTGSSAHEQLSRARALGIDVIVCDHHLFASAPPVEFFLNPHREDCGYPHQDLCGCAVAFKLVQAMEVQRPGILEPERELELVALGLIADQMELRGEIRGLVRRGLARAADNPRPGILALLEIARLVGQRPSADDFAFQIAPRINAAGRIDSPRAALDLLLTDDPGEARRLAHRLDEVNRRRREMDRLVTDEALRDAEQMMAGNDKPGGLVLASDRWHMGVVGISAARVTEECNVPAVVLAIDGEEAKGSARSIAGLDLKAALDGCAQHLTRYGGHAAAAGMTLRSDAIDAFRVAFAKSAAAQPRDAAAAGLVVDAQLGLGELDASLVEFLERYGPFGSGHRAPIFASFGLSRLGDPRVVGSDHLKMHLSDGIQERSFIGFRMAESYLPEARRSPSLDLAYRVQYREGSSFDPWELHLVALREAQAERPTAEGTG